MSEDNSIVTPREGVLLASSRLRPRMLRNILQERDGLPLSLPIKNNPPQISIGNASLDSVFS